jgi:hypothetical protein
VAYFKKIGKSHKVKNYFHKGIRLTLSVWK